MLFRRLFMRLVTFGEGAEDTRRVVGRAELDQEEWSLAQRLANEDNRLIVTGALGGVIVGLIGWINQGFIKEQWNWYWTVRPFVAANIWPYVRAAEAERALKPGDSFRDS
jgi:hypothetical protein